MLNLEVQLEHYKHCLCILEAVKNNTDYKLSDNVNIIGIKHKGKAVPYFKTVNLKPTSSWLDEATFCFILRVIYREFIKDQCLYTEQILPMYSILYSLRHKPYKSYWYKPYNLKARINTINKAIIKTEKAIEDARR